MCYRPLHISRYSNGKFAYDVPCGHCAQCRQNRVDEITFRIWYEFSTLNNEYQLKTGKTESRGIFSTLTFNDTHLPRCLVNEFYSPVFDDDGYLCNFPKSPKLVSCWDKASVQSFLKGMNDNLLYYIGSDILGIQRIRKGRITDEWHDFLDSYNNPYGNRPVKYFLVCERGKNGTRRPHLHMITLVCDTRLSVAKVKDYIREHWQDFGFSYNLTVGGERSDFDCIKYVCKYVLKDNQEPLQASNLIFESEEHRKNCCPFTLQSNFLGACYLDNVSLDNLHFLCEHGVSLGGKKPKSICLPRYYRKKLTTTNRELLSPVVTGSGELRVMPDLRPFDIHSYLFTPSPFERPYAFGVVNSRHQVFSNDVELGTQSYIFDNFDNFADYFNKKRYYTPLNEYGKRFQDFTAERTARTFCDLLDVVRVDSSLFYSVSGFPDFLDIGSISKRSLSLFIRKGLYRFFDNANNEFKRNIYPITRIMYEVYSSLRNYKNYLSKQTYLANQYNYVNQLSDVMSNKPQLFNTELYAL